LPPSTCSSSSPWSSPPLRLGVSPAIVGRIQGRRGGPSFRFWAASPALILLFVTIALLLLMIGLLVAVPFGTMVYLAVYGTSRRSGPEATLGPSYSSSFTGVFFLVLASEQVLKASCLSSCSSVPSVSRYFLSFLQGFPPGSRQYHRCDRCIIAFVVAIIWAIIYLIGGIISVVRTVRKVGSANSTVTVHGAF